MELSHIKTFIQIAKSGSMTKASQELHRTQPALSAQLAKLEEELQEPLFDRTPKGMILTDAGSLFLDYAEQAISRLDDGIDALTKFKGLEHGFLTVGGGVTATTYLLPKLFGTFVSQHPSIRLFVSEKGTTVITDDILRGTLDLGIVTLPIQHDERNLNVIPWKSDELYLIVPPTHKLSRQTSFYWPDIQHLPLILFEQGSPLRAQIDSRLQMAGIVPRVVMELRSIEAIKQMVSQGIGGAFVSQYSLNKNTPPLGLACKKEPITRTLGIIHRSDTSMSPAAQTFLSMLLEHSDFKT